MADSYVRQNRAYVELSKKIKTYVDVSLSFKPSPVTNDITLLTNEKAINNAIKNIIMFLPSEVPFDAQIGSTTSRYLFDVIDEATAGLLATEIERAILYCESRVSFKQLDVNTVDVTEMYMSNRPSTPGNLFFQDDLGVYVEAQPDQNQFTVSVKYRIVGGEQVYRVQEILTPTR